MNVRSMRREETYATIMGEGEGETDLLRKNKNRQKLEGGLFFKKI
jgi:hypothetical protein